MSFEDVVQELVSGPLQMTEDAAKALEPALDDIKAGLQKVADVINADRKSADIDAAFAQATQYAEKLVKVGGDAIKPVVEAMDAAVGKTFSELVQAFHDAAAKL